MTEQFKLYCTITPLNKNRRRLKVHNPPEQEREFEDIEQIQAYINRCLKDKKVYSLE